MDGRADRAIRATAVGAVLLALLAVVAFASGQGRPGVAGTTDVIAVANVRDVVLTAGATLYLFAIALVVWAFWSHRMRGGKLDRPSGIGSLLLFLLFAVVFAYGINNRPQPTIQPVEVPPGGEIGEQPPGSRVGEETEQIPPARFRWPLAAGLTAAGAALVAALVVAGRRREGEEVELEPLTKRRRAAADLARVLEGTLDDLRRERDPRRAVIAAYAQMETALARHGLPRDPSEAPFEYLGRMLGELRVRPEAALALTELFERARFSDHEIDVEMKEEAIQALVSVRDDLRAA